MNQITALKLKIRRARYNIMFMIVLSAINILFLSSGNNVTMPFSSSIASYAVAFGVKSAQDGENNMKLLGLFVAFLVLLIFIICHLFSKKNVVYFFIAFALLLADTIVLFGLNISTGTIGNIFVLLDLLLHILTLIYIFHATKAHIQLSKMPEFVDTSAPISFPENDFGAKECANNNYNDSDNQEEYNEDTDDYEVEEDLTQPISLYSNDNPQKLVSGNCGKLSVFAVIEDNIAKLIINDYVCDELNVEYLDEFQLRAIVNEIDFVFEFNRSSSGETMYLYADDTLLDSFGRL